MLFREGSRIAVIQLVGPEIRVFHYPRGLPRAFAQHRLDEIEEIRSRTVSRDFQREIPDMHES